MEKPIQILIVEDEMIIAANLSLQLTSLGYDVTGIIPRAEEALSFLQQRPPDIILLDINLKGQIDGIDMAHEMQRRFNIPIILSDSIFVRHHDKKIKVDIKNILYIEAERNYCRIQSIDKEYLLVMTLKDLSEKLPAKHFIRIHRSFIINVAQIDEVASTHLVIAKKAIRKTTHQGRDKTNLAGILKPV